MSNFQIAHDMNVLIRHFPRFFSSCKEGEYRFDLLIFEKNRSENGLEKSKILTKIVVD